VDLDRAEEFLRSFTGKKLIITTHKNADPDAIGCAFVVKKVCTSLGIEAEVCLPEGPSSVSKKIMGTLGAQWRERCQEADGAVVCDTSNAVMLGDIRPLLEAETDILVIDHHFPPGVLAERAKVSIIAREPASTVIAVLLADRLGVEIDSRTALIALTGILYDTRRYLYTSPSTFLASKILLESGADYAQALKLIEEKEDRSELIARLKGVQRASVIDVCGYVIAVTESSAHEASVARTLVSLGVDLAIVLGGHDATRVSVRASERLLERGFDSSKLVSSVAKMLGGEGGGHPGASGYTNLASKKLRGIRNRTLRQFLLNAIAEVMAFCEQTV